MLVQAREGRNNFPMQLSRLGISLIDSFDSSQTCSNPLINEKPVYLTAFCRIFNVWKSSQHHPLENFFEQSLKPRVSFMIEVRYELKFV